MNKKIVIAGIALLIIGGGGFFVWQNGKDVRELNKNLPEGVSVSKSLFGNDYKVVNKIDGYEFEVPNNLEIPRNVNYYDDFSDEKNLDFRTKTSEGIKNKTISENALYLDGTGLNFIQINKIVLKESIDLLDFVKDLEKSSPESQSLRNIPTIEAMQVDNVKAYELWWTYKGFGGDLLPSIITRTFQKENNLYVILYNFNYNKENINGLMLKGKW